MMFLNFLGFNLVSFIVDLLLAVAWIIPLFYVVKNLIAYLTAPTPVLKQEAQKAVFQSGITLVTLIILVILFNAFARSPLGL